MNKKVVQIVRSPDGGIRKHILTIMHGLKDEYDIYLICDVESGDLHFQNFLKTNPDTSKKVLNLKIVDNPSLRDIPNILSTLKFCRQNQIKIFHGHGAKGGVYARVVSALTGGKSLYTTHGGALHDMHGKLKNIIYSIIEKLLYFLTDRLLFESKYSMSQFESKVHLRSDKFILNYNGVCLPEGYDSIAPESLAGKSEIKLAAFGLLRKIKGHDILIRSIRIINDRGYCTKLKIYGDGEEKKYLENLITKLGQQDHIEICGKTLHISEKMKEADFIIHPSLFESFGYVPVEAGVEGRFVISSLAGGLSEVMDAGKNGFCVDEVSPESLADAIEQAIKNPELREEKFWNFKKYIKTHFDEKRFISQMRQIYSEL